LWELAALHFLEATQVFAWGYLVENLHRAAELVFSNGTEQAKNGAEERDEELWPEKCLDVRQHKVALQKRRGGTKRETSRKLGVYSGNNAELRDAPLYRLEPLPIGGL